MVAVIKTEADIKSLINNSKGLLVVDAFAVWCNPCKVLAPKLEQMQQAYPSIRIVKVDVEELADFAEEYSISAMPTLLFFKNGIEVDRVMGANEPSILKAIQKYM